MHVADRNLQIHRDLILSGVKQASSRLFMPYTREGTLDSVRAKSFDCLVDLNALKQPVLVQYIFNVLGTDPSPYIRHRIWQALEKGLGMLAIGDSQPAGGRQNPGPGEMTIVDESGDDSNDRKDVLARETIVGSIENLKKVLADNNCFKEALWKAVT